MIATYGPQGPPHTFADDSAPLKAIIRSIHKFLKFAYMSYKDRRQRPFEGSPSRFLGIADQIGIFHIINVNRPGLSK